MADAQELVAQGDRAYREEDFEAAVAAYTQALEAPGQVVRADVFMARCQARTKTEDWEEAASDASQVMELAVPNTKQHMLGHLRRGVALFNMEEYEAAQEVFEAAAALYPENSMLKTWIRKCRAELEDLTIRTDIQPALPPPVSAPKAPAPKAQQPKASTPGASPSTARASTAAEPAASAAAPAAAPVPPPVSIFEGIYRHQHYQLQNKVNVDVYAKGVSKDQVSVTFGEQHLTVIITRGPDEEPYNLDVELFGKIVPESCRYEVLRTKVEITMTKADGQQWASLEKSSQVTAPSYSSLEAPPAAGRYPSSHAKAKDWSKVEAEVKELESKGELEDGDPLNSFFKKIFSQGDEDQRRAMMKSFVESNGTVLSTNWNEVGAKKVECTPPDGMEAKKWGKQ
eukprot:CAMPEP_0119102810 /NCGR_PEP_ID=MMETSP1180-20130426/1428_1 /TAXON_ID=3052 ORGANISM="Chlamydomonas cf sp, Strain CCMP681" /NCGR_SAMPLE_ID=MMETSP1180 /ASSEMBLY_ACC=CAM_ASM_000741 /LENGTH=398 /DNA_ID=CAMNT_0007087163 /DNA_START=27 /DNA_END=1223 /DNA_ORIENTATION=+